MSKTTNIKEIVLKPGKRRKQGGAGTKKHGRNKVKCAKYRAEGRREKNKARKMKKQTKFEAKKAERKGNA